MHATKMYDLGAMQNRKLFFGTWIVGILTVGFGIPVFGVWWQQKKAQG